MEDLPTFTIENTPIHVGKYTVRPFDPCDSVSFYQSNWIAQMCSSIKCEKMFAYLIQIFHVTEAADFGHTACTPLVLLVTCLYFLPR